ncbi:MAG: DUF4445 domain-containing protein, partial [Lentisphaerae bacterium]
IIFLPSLAGFVGSDILAGVLACGMDEHDEFTMLVDLGTNGELIIGNKDGFLCASTAVGPAFEAATISCGMSALPGAIAHVDIRDGKLNLTTIGDHPPVGICGSGLIDLVTAWLRLGVIDETGRLQGSEDKLQVSPNVKLTPRDIRELQLGKGAIATGIRILLEEMGPSKQPETVFLAGAFGNYCRIDSLKKLGMFPFPQEIPIQSVGNSALRGAKLALVDFDATWRRIEAIIEKTRSVELNLHPKFTDYYTESMFFPVLCHEEKIALA